MAGCYIPFDWAQDFSEAYRKHIRYVCLVMSRSYIETRFSDIRAHACAIEQRGDDDDFTVQSCITDNEAFLRGCRAHGLNCLLIDGLYDIDAMCRSVLNIL